MRNAALKWELIGIAVISVLGSAAHFVFGWGGEWPPLGAFFPVNESVFEHLKLTFLPTVIYGAATWRLVKRPAANFVLGKAVGVFVMPAVILAMFYAYEAITGSDSLVYDIITFVVAVACGQMAAYGVMSAKRLPAWVGWLGAALIAALGAAYALLTFYPPQVPLFRDSLTGGYGLP